MAMESSPSNTYIFDPESGSELARLINQESMLTSGMGGVLKGLSEEDIAGLHNVLDLGSGPGGWVLDVAFAHPDIEVAGIDISKSMVDYANARAQSQGLTNASFEVMDLTKPLEFPDGAFDLINARFLFAALKRDAWPSFIAECSRLLRPGGILFLTEPVDLGISSSAALTRMSTMLAQAMWQEGYAFSVDGHSVGITYMLPHLLRRAGYQEVTLLGYALDYSVDTLVWADGYRNSEVAYYQAQPLLVKHGFSTPEDLQRLYQQMLIEFHAEDFCFVSHYMTAFGRKVLA